MSKAVAKTRLQTSLPSSLPLPRKDKTASSRHILSSHPLGPPHHAFKPLQAAAEQTKPLLQSPQTAQSPKQEDNGKSCRQSSITPPLSQRHTDTPAPSAGNSAGHPNYAPQAQQRLHPTILANEQIRIIRNTLSQCGTSDNPSTQPRHPAKAAAKQASSEGNGDKTAATKVSRSGASWPI